MAAQGILAGRLAIVTGGGSGIGRAVSKLFAKEGARVAVVDQNIDGAKETVKILQGDHHAFSANVASSAEVTQLVTDVRTQFAQPPCAVVNSAGITRDNFLLKLDEKKFDEVIDVNLKGTFLVCQAVARSLVEANIQPATFVNISSLVAKMGNIGQANYAASKAGVVALTKTTALELTRFGIRCNAILPGFIQTPMSDAVPEKVIEKMKTLIPMARMGQPEEIAEACLFLSSQRSSYITGAVLEVTGGMAM